MPSSPLSLANRHGLGRGSGFSAALHAALVLLVLLSLGRSPRPVAAVPPAIVVELVPYGGAGNANRTQASAPQAEPAPAPSAALTPAPP
jgi:hypothetical protein